MNAQSKIEPQIVVAADGTVTLPAGVAARAGWTAGMKLDLVARPAEASLRTPSTSTKLSVDEVFARLAALSPNPGPMITIEQMDEAVREAAVERYRRSF